MEKETKEAFFDELYQLDQEDSGEEDQSNASVILRQSRIAWPDVPRNSSVHSSPPVPSQLSTFLTPLPQPVTPSCQQAKIVERSSSSLTASSKQSEQFIDTLIMANKTVKTNDGKEASKVLGKRKRNQSLELRPESQRIFSGLAFCK